MVGTMGKMKGNLGIGEVSSGFERDDEGLIFP